MWFLKYVSGVADRQTFRHTFRQTDRHSDIQTDRQTDRQTDSREIHLCRVAGNTV